MPIARIKEWAYPQRIEDIKDVDKYLRVHHQQHVDESVDRITDFESLEIDTLTVSEWTIQTSFQPSADATVDLGAVGTTDYRFRHLYLSGNLSDETNSLTVANAKSAYTHSQVAGGDSVHVSTAENTAWDAAKTHADIAGGNSVHVSTAENTAWDAKQAGDAGLTSLAGLVYASDSFIKVTATDTYDIRTLAETKTDLSLNAVENTALSTWGGTSNITTLGTIGTGLWQGTAIANTYIAGLDQNCLQASSPTFVTAKLSALTDGYVPYHVSDALGLANSPLKISGTFMGTWSANPRTTFHCVKGAGTNYPALGTVSGSFAVGGDGINYGLDVGAWTDGNSWLQAHRFDGTATAYNLILQPSGGNVGIGVTDPDTLLELYKVGTQLKLSGGAADYATFAVAADGALTITTVDVDAAEADIILAPDGEINVSTSKITNVVDPAAAQDAATKAYVDSVATGLEIKSPVRVATIAALPANTAAGHEAGKTLTADANGVLTVDGVATVLNNRILVKNQSSADDGIYKVTTEGTAGVAFILTRATDADTDAEVNAGMYCFVTEGDTLIGTAWVLNSEPEVDVDTPSFIQFSFATSFVEDDVYGAGWDTDTAHAPSQNAVYDIFNSHKDRHDPNDGADALDCAASAEIAGVQAAAEGTAHTFARSDHAHQIQHAIADNHLVTIDGTCNDNEYARFTADGIEGRTEAEFKADFNLEIGTDVLAQQTIGIADNNLLEVDHVSPADDDYAKFTASGLEGRSYAEVRTDLGLVIGTNVQAYDAGLTNLAAVAMVADRMYYTSGDNVHVATPITATGRSILDDASTGAVLTTIGAAASSHAMSTHSDEDTYNILTSGYIGLKSSAELRFYDNGNYVGFEAPALVADQIWVLPAIDGSANQYLKTGGTGTLTWDTPSGAGDVVGSASSTDNAIVRFNGTTGKAIQNSGIIIDDSDNVGIGISSWGTSADKVLGIGGSTAPTTSPADMVQLWSADRSAGSANLYYRAEGGQARPLGREFDVSDYGLVPDDNTGTVPADNVTAWGVLIGKTAAGDKIYFPKGVWYIDDGLTVNQSVTIYGDGESSEIKQETAAKAVFNISVSDVTIRDLKLVGTGYTATYTSGSVAIHAYGADSSNYITNIKVVDCYITSWKMYGILLEYVTNFDIAFNHIEGITYGGIVALSSEDGRICHNYVKDLTGHSDLNAYGISLNKLKNSLATYPRCKRVVIDSNVVTDIPTWDGISTHAAEDCVFNNNIVRSTKRGINCVGDDTYGSINNTISNNIVDIGSVTAGASVAGISFAGESGELGTGCIVGNVIIGHGDEDSQTSGGLSIKYTQGVAITGNRITSPASRGIMLYQHNYDFVVSGNTISDVWSESHDVSAIQVNSVSNVGYIGENSWANVTRSSDYYLGSGASFGIYINNQTGNDISLGNNHSEDADTYVGDAGGKADIFWGSDTWNPASIAVGAMEAKDVTVNGAALGDSAVASLSLDLTDLVLNAQVTTANTVTCVLSNNTAGAVDLASGTIYVKVIKK